MTRYIVCITQIYHYFVEYILSFQKALNLELLLLNDFHDHNYNETDLYIFIRTMPPNKVLQNKKIKTIFLNTEQLSRSEYLQSIATCVAFKIPIVDYSPANIKLSGQGHLLRYQYNSEEINGLKYIRSRVSQSADVGFTGCSSERRENILNEIRGLGCQVKHVHAWGIDREKELLGAKIVLNLHYANDYNIYESIRCDRLLFAGVPVITEPSLYQNLVDVNPLLILSDYENIALKTQKVVERYDYYCSMITEELIESIANDRRQDIHRIEELLTNIDL